MRAALRAHLPVLLALGLCPVAALLIGTDPAEPVGRAEALAGAEAALGLHVEPAAHAWLDAHNPLLMTLAGVVYVIAHVAVTGWALIWTWCLRRDAFPLVRDTLVVTQVLIVAIAVAMPTAPPRLVPGMGIGDEVAATWGGTAAGLAHAFQSPFAAMPSGHVAFALVAGGAFAALGDRAWLRAFGRLHPPLVLALVVVTGNHLWLDAAAALAVVAVAFAIARARRAPAGAVGRFVRGPAPGPGRARGRASAERA
jgi:hypothetical protein